MAIGKNLQWNRNDGSNFLESSFNLYGVPKVFRIERDFFLRNNESNFGTQQKITSFHGLPYMQKAMELVKKHLFHARRGNNTG